MTGEASSVKALPKAELHMHVEGSLEPVMMFELGRRNGMALGYDSVEAVRAAYSFDNLDDFLALYYQGMSVFQTAADFRDLALAYFQRAVADGVCHTEIFFDPQAHLPRGLSFETVISGLTRAREEAKAEFGITSHLILCFLRDRDADEAEQMLDLALAHKDAIIGVGLDSSELGHPPNKFQRVFRRARDEGFRLVAHAGEEGPPEYVWQAIDVLGVDRIDHGNRALEDPALTRRLAQDRIPLTVCPLSNLCLRVVQDLSHHPIRQMLDAGLLATVNSDDPAYFGGYIDANFRSLEVALGLSEAEAGILARNSLAASFMGREEKAASLQAFDAAVGARSDG